ncbi:MFS transporter, partial [Nocardioides aquaticus]
MSAPLAPDNRERTAPSAEEVTRAQTRTLRVLVLAQALGAVGITIGIATASLLARDLSGRDSLAGLAQTFQVLGAAVASWLLARLMSRRGRRIGLVSGWLLGAAGGAVVVVAGAVGSMLLLLAGAVLLGSATAANSGARYAATDLAVADRRARSLAVVVWATTIGAVAGPNLTGPAAGLATALGLPALTGPFLVATAGMLVAALVIGVLLRPDPLLLARAAAGPPVGPPTGTSWSRVRAAVAETP